MRQHRWPTLVCAAILILSLGACRKSDSDKIPPVESGHAAPVETQAQLADLLAMLVPGDISHIDWSGPNAPTAEALAQLLAQAAEHTVASEDDDSPAPYYGLWSAEFHFDPWEVQVILSAGLRENVVMLTTEDLPDQALYLEEQTLYHTLRTVHDIPRSVEEEVYARSRGLIDHYYDTLLENLSQLDGGFDRWALNTLIPADEREDLGAQAYEMSAALYAPTPELAARQLAGGMVLDSQLRTFGLEQQYAYLVTVDGQPAGILPRTASDNPETILESYVNLADLNAHFWTAWGK